MSLEVAKDTLAIPVSVHMGLQVFYSHKSHRHMPEALFSVFCWTAIVSQITETFCINLLHCGHMKYRDIKKEAFAFIYLMRGYQNQRKTSGDPYSTGLLERWLSTALLHKEVGNSYLLQVYFVIPDLHDDNDDDDDGDVIVIIITVRHSSPCE